MDTSDANDVDDLMSLDEIIAMQQRHHDSKASKISNVEKEDPSKLVTTPVATIRFNADSVRSSNDLRFRVTSNVVRNGNAGPNVVFDKHSLLQFESPRPPFFRGRGYLQNRQQQRFPLIRQFGSPSHSDHFQGRNFSFKQQDFNRELQHQVAQRGCCTNYGGRSYGQLRRSASNSSLAASCPGFGRNSYSSSESHGSFHVAGPSSHSSRSASRGPPDQGWFGDGFRSRSRSRSRSGSRSRSRSRSCGRGNGDDGKPKIFTKRHEILNDDVQRAISKIQAKGSGRFSAPHCGAVIQLTVNRTGMSLHDRFGSYYSE